MDTKSHKNKKKIGVIGISSPPHFHVNNYVWYVTMRSHIIRIELSGIGKSPGPQQPSVVMDILYKTAAPITIRTNNAIHTTVKIIFFFFLEFNSPFRIH